MRLYLATLSLIGLLVVAAALGFVVALALGIWAIVITVPICMVLGWCWGRASAELLDPERYW